MRIVAAVACSMLMSTGAYAFSGAEFLAADRDFGVGYAFGALEYRLTIGTAAEQDAVFKAKACFRDAGITSDIFYDAVRSYMNNNLSTLTEPAIAGVLKASIELCPWDAR